jgi:hypothetical protein
VRSESVSLEQGSMLVKGKKGTRPLSTGVVTLSERPSRAALSDVSLEVINCEVYENVWRNVKMLFMRPCVVGRRWSGKPTRGRREV